MVGAEVGNYLRMFRGKLYKLGSLQKIIIKVNFVEIKP